MKCIYITGSLTIDNDSKTEMNMKKYLTTAVSISVLFFLLCAIKGIFPFGTATIDTVDFASQWVPGYYHVWDVLHGNASLFFDWRVAGGMDLTGAASQFSLLSPYNLLLIFIGRGQIQPFMTFFIWIKVVAMGLTMCFFLQKMAEKRAYVIAGWDVVWLTAGSVSYTLSAYTFAYYGMGWIDIASILPILIYNLMQMLTEEQDWKPGKHAIGYTVCLFLIFCVNIPQAYMICFFLILFAGGYVKFFPPFRHRVYRGKQLFLAVVTKRHGPAGKMADAAWRVYSAFVPDRDDQKKKRACVPDVSGPSYDRAGSGRSSQSDVAQGNLYVFSNAAWLYDDLCHLICGVGALSGTEGELQGEQMDTTYEKGSIRRGTCGMDGTYPGTWRSHHEHKCAWKRC